MDLNRIISMITNQLIRRVVNMAVDGGLRFASRKTAALTKPDPEQPVPDAITTPDDPAKDARLRSLAEQAANAARMSGSIRR